MKVKFKIVDCSSKLMQKSGPMPLVNLMKGPLGLHSMFMGLMSKSGHVSAQSDSKENLVIPSISGYFENETIDSIFNYGVKLFYSDSSLVGFNSIK